jgi:hypothetical protein
MTDLGIILFIALPCTAQMSYLTGGTGAATALTSKV